MDILLQVDVNPGLQTTLAQKLSTSKPTLSVIAKRAEKKKKEIKTACQSNQFSH